MSSSTTTSDDETISLVTARSSSPAEKRTPSNSSISNDDITKTPARKSVQHVGAGDSVGRSFHDNTLTSQQGTTSRRRPRVIPRRKDYGTPQAPPKRQLLGGSSGMGGFYHMPMSFSQSKSDGHFNFDDIDVLLYTVKELCALVESERFVCGPTFMA
uniref:Uncharacterized protein n=1 Tax=Panagrolaimus sp. ES5 TaxID=591445 RepID=A0AC34F5I5_9BILA